MKRSRKAMKINLTVSLYRYALSNQGTKGIAITGRGALDYFCVLELPWRDNEPNYSCIPDGEYLCKFRKSKKFGEHYILQDVEGRTWILTHSGNLAGDTKRGWKTHSHGCLLSGSRFGKIKLDEYKYQDAVLNSRPTLRKLITAMNRENFTLRIVTIGNIGV